MVNEIQNSQKKSKEQSNLSIQKEKVATSPIQKKSKEQKQEVAKSPIQKDSFRFLLSQISKDLSKVEWKNMVDPYPIDKEVRDRFERAFDFFEYLIQIHAISSNNVSILKEALNDIQRIDLVDILESFEHNQ
jgi:hypothetical protein